MQSSATTPSEEGRAPWSAASGRSATEKLTRVPSPAVEVTLRRSLLRRMLGRPMPAPNPSARASEEAVDQPSRIADSTSGMPGPVVDDVHVQLAVADGRLEAAAALGVDDDVHLGLVGGDHGAPHRVALGADPLEVLLEVARRGAGARKSPQRMS